MTMQHPDWVVIDNENQAVWFYSMASAQTYAQSMGGWVSTGAEWVLKQREDEAAAEYEALRAERQAEDAAYQCDCEDCQAAWARADAANKKELHS